MKTLYILFIIIIFAGLAMGGNVLIPGVKAQDFELKDSEGNVHHLSDYRGKMVALYFYPKDFTPGCTAEASNLCDNYEALMEKGLVVLGVSYDKPQKHKEFKEKYNLPFTLLSDTTKSVAEAYGAKGSLTGFMFPKRITYLIDGDGTVLHVFEKVNNKSHAEQILEFLEKNNIY